jgi:NAD(P)-dependent dehydrogenase (short-subunit alcohol dehydrogenase family)
VEGLQGQVALVTGGSRGIGRAICEHLLGSGATVAAGYSRDVDAARSLADGHDGRVSIHQGNIGAVDDCNRVIAEVFEQHGRIDILVNNAGITLDRTVRKMTPDDWHRVLRVNLSGAFYMCHGVLQKMIDQAYGRIVNISSVIGEMGNIGQANYAAAKSGLFGLTKTLALETARHGITVNCVAPGFIATDMVEAVPKEVLDRVIAEIPVRRLGEPDEVARVVDFLVDPAAGYITGAVVSVNGGIHM